MKPVRLHRPALGGFTVDGPYCRRRPSLAVLIWRFTHWLGA